MIGVLTLIYTYLGGIKAVVWVDAAQMVLYLFGALVAVAGIQALVPGGWSSVLASAAPEGKLAMLDLSLDRMTAYTLWAGIFGGAIFTMASHGTDQLIVQRLLTCRDRQAAQKALIGSGIAVIFQFLLLFLLYICFNYL